MRIAIERKYTKEILEDFASKVVGDIPVQQRDIAYNILTSYFNLSEEEMNEMYLGWKVGNTRVNEYLEAFKYLKYESLANLIDYLQWKIEKVKLWRKTPTSEQKACFTDDHRTYNEQAHRLDTREDEIKVEVATKLLALINGK